MTENQDDIDQINAEQIIVEAYYQAIKMLDNVEVLNVLKDHNVLDLNALSDFVNKYLSSNSKMYDYSSQLNNMDDYEFEIDDDNDKDDENDETNSDHQTDQDNTSNPSDDENDSDEGEQDDNDISIDSSKQDFTGMKVFNTVQNHMKHAYFQIILNGETKYIHKQTACWLLTDDKVKISNDRLLRVQQTNESF